MAHSRFSYHSYTLDRIFHNTIVKGPLSSNSLFATLHRISSHRKATLIYTHIRPKPGSFHMYFSCISVLPSWSLISSSFSHIIKPTHLLHIAVLISKKTAFVSLFELELSFLFPEYIIVTPHALTRHVPSHTWMFVNEIFFLSFFLSFSFGTSKHKYA